jgi:hypothetical protein
MHDNPSNVTSAVSSSPSVAMLGIQFIKTRWLLLSAISAVVLIPCFWHRRIEAGDLASHTYNAWLFHLIKHGQAPGLYIQTQWNNILVDVALAQLGSAVGFIIAEKIVASVCVLIFFWGAFALIASASRRAPWFLTPAIAMISYGWTFQMGFMNYYLSLGLGFFALALAWQGKRWDWILVFILAVLTIVAHPLGFLFLISAGAYIKLADRQDRTYRWALFGSALLALVVLRYYIVLHFQSDFWETSIFYEMNGADQLVLYGSRYVIVAMAALLFAALAFIYADMHEGKGTSTRWRFRTPLQVWVILLFAAAMIPELIQLPHYAAPIGFPVSRLTSVTAIFGLCVLGHFKARRWHLVGLAAIAAVFFVWMYQDTGALNRMEEQAQDLVSSLPYGQRVTATIDRPPRSRIFFINHPVDRACIGHCFAYSNYEPSSGQFRIRVRAGSPVVADSPAISHALESGEYVVRPEDLPMAQIYQCDDKDFTQLCMREMTAGEKTGRIGHIPSVP